RVEARVIHPDGRITELERDAVYTQDDFRLGHERRERVTFALPNLEPGCIVDYRWRAVHKGKAHGLRFYTQARYPTHELFIRFAFYPHLRAAWTTSGFPSSWLEERNGGHELRMRQLAAAPDEEFLPTPDEIVPWITTYYLFQRGDDWVREFWTDFAKVLAREEKAFQTRHRAIRRQAEELTAGAAGEEEALRRLFAYCQGEILNLEDEANGLSTREIEQYAELKKATDVLKNGYGDASLINALFGSLAGALGYEVRWAAATDRSEGAFSSKRAYYYALPDRLVALRREGEHAWRFFDPGTPEAAFTHLAWWNEDTRALLGNRDGPYFVDTPRLSAEASSLRREGDLEIAPDGSLQGNVVFTFDGHLRSLFASGYRLLTPEEQTEAVHDLLGDLLPNAEVDALRLDWGDAVGAPLVMRFVLTAPGFASRTGQRLFLEPHVFGRDDAPFFAPTKRRHDISFAYRWTAIDDLRLHLPAGFTVEEVPAPAGEIRSSTFTHTSSVEADEAARLLHVQRHYASKTLTVPVENYAAVQGLLAEIFEIDHQLFILRQTGEEGAAADPLQ
ncbi:MAG: hypothetical protein ACLFR7_04370, partial [Opitutales bacterium]